MTVFSDSKPHTETYVHDTSFQVGWLGDGPEMFLARVKIVKKTCLESPALPIFGRII